MSEENAIHVARASSVKSGFVIDPVTICVDQDIPGNLHGDGWEERYNEFFMSEAMRIVDALESTLPGATLDRVFSELCHRRASQFWVPVKPPRPGAEKHKPNTITFAGRLTEPRP